MRKVYKICELVDESKFTANGKDTRLDIRILTEYPWKMEIVHDTEQAAIDEIEKFQASFQGKNLTVIPSFYIPYSWETTTE